MRKKKIIAMPATQIDLADEDWKVVANGKEIRLWNPLSTTASTFTPPQDLPPRGNLWHEARRAAPPAGCEWPLLKRLVTGSQMYVVTLQGKTTVAEAEALRAYHKGLRDAPPEMKMTSSMRWGVLCEPNGIATAVHYFTRGQGKSEYFSDEVVQLRETGLLHNEEIKGFAATPDGLLYILGEYGEWEKYAVVEIKSPYFKPFSHDEGMEVGADEDGCDVLELSWLMQVVFQMKAARVETGYILRWAPKKSHVFEVLMADVDRTGVWQNFLKYFSEMWMSDRDLGKKPRGTTLYNRFKKSLEELHANVAMSMVVIDSIAHAGASNDFEE